MRVAIIGGSGKMGRWFASFLLKDGKEVVITGRDEKKLAEAGQQLGVAVATNREAVQQADVILLSVLIDSFEAVVSELAPWLKPDQIIIDITSIKVFPVDIMHKYHQHGLVLGVHPMFGPGARDITNQNLVLTPTDERELALAEKVKQYLVAHGARVSLMTPREHDEMMAVILGLAHFIAIVSADTLLSLNRLPEMEAIGGSTYKLLLTLAKGVMTEDAEFYASLQMNLPGVTEIQEQFQRSSATWANIVRQKNRPEFVRSMNALRDKMAKADPDFRKAYENMYRLIGE